MSTPTPRPDYWDGRYGTERTLAQQRASRASQVALERTELKRLGQAIVKADRAGKRGKALALAALVSGRKANIARHEEELARLQALEAEERLQTAIEHEELAAGGYEA